MLQCTIFIHAEIQKETSYSYSFELIDDTNIFKSMNEKMHLFETQNVNDSNIVKYKSFEGKKMKS